MSVKAASVLQKRLYLHKVYILSYMRFKLNLEANPLHPHFCDTMRQSCSLDTPSASATPAKVVCAYGGCTFLFGHIYNIS